MENNENLKKASEIVTEIIEGSDEFESHQEILDRVLSDYLNIEMSSDEKDQVLVLVNEKLEWLENWYQENA
jgi:hypothetical protein